MGKRYEEDIASIAAATDVPWDAFEGKTVVVTGATGLLGGLIARALACRGLEGWRAPKVVLLVRDLEKARALFGEAVAEPTGTGTEPPLVGAVAEPAEQRRPACPELVLWDAETGAIPDVSTCDVIIHCASNTDSRRMVEQPVNTVLATVEGTRAMLELARATGARMCFVSSMEVYGAGSAAPLDEACGGALEAMSVRSSYPQAKQLAETLCASYASQYGVSACVARLAQSFGPGISASDRRVFAEFARCCRAGKNINLITDGSKSNMYVYTADAVRALLILAARGEAGTAYNVANEKTFCSVWEMAHMVADAFGPSTEVTRVIDEEAASRYAVSGRIWMDTARVRALGWRPRVDLPAMYGRMMDDWD